VFTTHISLIASFYGKSQSATTGRSYMSSSVSADTNGFLPNQWRILFTAVYKACGPACVA
jgi:hypothetical protein